MDITKIELKEGQTYAEYLRELKHAHDEHKKAQEEYNKSLECRRAPILKTCKSAASEGHLSCGFSRASVMDDDVKDSLIADGIRVTDVSSRFSSVYNYQLCWEPITIPVPETQAPEVAAEATEAPEATETPEAPEAPEATEATESKSS